MVMHDKLINYFLKFTLLSDDEKRVLAESMEIRRFKSGSFLVKEGQPTSDTFFILEGIARQFKIIDGQEVITNFYAEDQWIISFTSFTETIPSTTNIVCIEDITAVVGDEKKAQILFELFPRLERVSRDVLETVVSEQQETMNNYLADTPEQRYIRLHNTNPTLFQRVPQYQIASYIGVKPESLSRIRKRLVTKLRSTV